MIAAALSLKVSPCDVRSSAKSVATIAPKASAAPEPAMLNSALVLDFSAEDMAGYSTRDRPVPETTSPIVHASWPAARTAPRTLCAASFAAITTMPMPMLKT